MKSQEQIEVRNTFPTLGMCRRIGNGTPHWNGTKHCGGKENWHPCSYVPSLSIKMNVKDIKAENHAKHTFAHAKDFWGSENARRYA